MGVISGCNGDELTGGCTDTDAINYDPDANFDDGSCEFANGSCDADFFYFPIAISENVVTILVGDVNPNNTMEWEWTVNGEEIDADGDGVEDYDSAFEAIILEGYGEYEICLETDDGVCEDTECIDLNFTAEDSGILEFNYENLGDLSFDFNSEGVSNGFAADGRLRFKWTFDDRFVAYGPSVNFRFPEPEMYEVCLELSIEGTDIRFEHCKTIAAFGIGIEENIAENITLYPNPATESIQLKNATDIEFVRILNTNGQLVYETAYTGLEIPVKQLPTALYILEITDKNSNKAYLRFSKQ